MAFDLYDLTANVSINMANIEVGFVNVCKKFEIRALDDKGNCSMLRVNDYQREAITQVVNKKTDLFINLPTGYGKHYLWFSIPFMELLVT